MKEGLRDNEHGVKESFLRILQLQLVSQDLSARNSLEYRKCCVIDLIALPLTYFHLDKKRASL